MFSPTLALLYSSYNTWYSNIKPSMYPVIKNSKNISRKRNNMNYINMRSKPNNNTTRSNKRNNTRKRINRLNE